MLLPCTVKHGAAEPLEFKVSDLKTRRRKVIQETFEGDGVNWWPVLGGMLGILHNVQDLLECWRVASIGALQGTSPNKRKSSSEQHTLSPKFLLDARGEAPVTEWFAAVAHWQLDRVPASAPGLVIPA